MSKTFLIYIPLTLACVASFQFHVYDSGSPPFHGDESTWLANSRALWLVLYGDFDSDYWQTYDGWTQPHAGHYAYGLVLWAAGVKPADLHQRYASNMDLAWNFAHGRVPSRQVLLAGRRFSAFCGALACVLVCEIGRRMWGWAAGLAAACWLAANPLMRFVSQQAMVDGQLALAMTSGTLALMLLFVVWQRRSPIIIILASLPVGLLLGLAAALKFNGGVLCVVALAAFCCFVLHTFLQRKHQNAPAIPSPFRRLLAAATSTVVVCVLALAVFYVANPQVWPRGLRHGIQYTMELRDHDVQGQQRAHPQDALTSLPQRVRAAADMLFVRWPTLRTAPLQDFRNAADAGDHRRGLWFIEAPGFLVGLICLIRATARKIRCDLRIDPSCIVLLLLVFYSIFIFLGMPLLWPRYYQTYLPLQALMVGVAFACLLQTLSRRKPAIHHR